jgi:hypothetical protein
VRRGVARGAASLPRRTLSLPFSADLPKIAGGRGLYLRCRRGKELTRAEKGRYANRETAQIFPIVFSGGRERADQTQCPDAIEAVGKEARPL